MSIIFGLRRDGDRVIDLMGVMRPGELGTISDMTETTRALIVMGCLPDDSGGIVYRAYDESTEVLDGPTPIPVSLVTDSNVIARLGPREMFELRIVTVSYAVGILAVAHNPGPLPPGFH